MGLRERRRPLPFRMVDVNSPRPANISVICGVAKQALPPISHGSLFPYLSAGFRQLVP